MPSFRVIVLVFLMCATLVIPATSGPEQLAVTNIKDIVDVGYKRIRTKWPLKAGYPGLQITNLNKYLRLFTPCLLTIRNYQGIEISEPPSPIVLMRYDYVKYDDCFPFDEYDVPYSKHFIEKVPPIENLTCEHNKGNNPEFGIIRSNRARWTCYARFDIFPPEILEAPHFYANHEVVNDEDLFKTYTNEALLNWFGYDVFSWNTKKSYSILIAHMNTTMITKNVWNLKSFSLSFSLQELIMLHFKTQNLRKQTSIQRAVSNNVKILSMNILHPYAKLAQISIPLDESNWEADVNHWIKFQGPLFINFDVAFNFQQFFDAPFTLRNVLAHKGILRHRGLAEFVFPNVTFAPYSLSLVKKYNDQVQKVLSLIPNSEPVNMTLVNYDLRDQTTFPHFILNSTTYMLLRSESEVFTFLSCGRNNREAPSFYAMISVFDKTVWILLITFVILWPVFLSYIDRPNDLGMFLNYCDAVMVGWSMLLDQSHLRATNEKRRTALYYYCGFSVLVLIVVSNAYRGDNFKSITKSFQVVPFEFVQQLVLNGYKVYSRVVFTSSIIFGDNFFRDLEFNDLLENPFYGLRYQLSDTHLEFLNSTIKEHYWDQINNVEYINASYYGSNSLNVEQMLDQCNNTAFVDWRPKLHPLYVRLAKKYGASNVFLGKEIIFKREYGWMLRHYKDPMILKRIKLLSDSGIKKMLSDLVYEKKPHVEKIPKPLSLNGNIVVIFSLSGFGILFSIFVVGLENLMCMVWLMDYGKYLIRKNIFIFL